MEETKQTGLLCRYAPLLFIIPTWVLLFFAFGAYSMYERGIDNIRYYGRNPNEGMIIGAIVWAVAGSALIFMFAVEMVLLRIGKNYKIPADTLIAASTWNMLVGAAMFSSNPLPCGFTITMPTLIFQAAVYLTTITFGLLLAGVAAIKFNSIMGIRKDAFLAEMEPAIFNRLERGHIRLARWMCLLNGILAILGLILLSMSGCLID